ncbi:hypothetical protein [Shewanella youngdeokensis]|uniref:Membrane anchored protein in chemotaxis locus n=1 Tax=Shewanella youngdeokensis TaxID=2999068 RepID=A0ABZ0K149_9GAMM|nr:hypothetical protein RGE70_05580 [Shewanella sp. DAU334]
MVNRKVPLNTITVQFGTANTIYLLIIFLLSVTIFTLGSFYIELKNKNALLRERVAELTDSQVLFMVPDEQAAVMANWMADNPEFVQSYVSQARNGEPTVMPVGAGAIEEPDSVATNTNVEVPPREAPLELVMPDTARLIDARKSNAEIVELKNAGVEHVDVSKAIALEPISEAGAKASIGVGSEPAAAIKMKVDEDGVNYISLPHGGIRITTRAPED